MKTTNNVTLYECDFCKKKLFVKGAMTKHEKICSKNPVNIKPCVDGCKFLTTIEKTVHFDGYDFKNDCDGRVVNAKVFKCELHDKLMFPYSIERNKRHIIYPDTFEGQEPMPNKCDDFKEFYLF